MNYQTIVNDLEEQIIRKFERRLAPNDSEYLDYLKVKANLQYFSLDEYADSSFDFFKKAWFYQKLAEKDQATPSALDLAKIKGTMPSQNSPCIYCTFHLGSYRLSNFVLVNQNIDFSLLVSQENIDKSNDDYVRLHEALAKRNNNNNSSFNILNAEEGKIGLQIIREVKNGRSLMVYLDGNTGVGGSDRKDDKLIPIQFLGKEIQARKGIAYLSYFLDIPIVPVISYRPEGQETTIEFLPPIIPTKELGRSQYTQETTQRLFDIFSEYLLKYPEQWEGWFYVNNFIDTSKIETGATPSSFKEGTSYIFNQSRYYLFMKDMLHYLFDIETYNCVKMPKVLWQLLQDVEKGEIDYLHLPHLLKTSLFDQLLKIGILVPETNEL